MRICSECGLDMDLVGLRHRCVPRVITKPLPEVITKPATITKPNKGGRRPIGERADDVIRAAEAASGEAEGMSDKSAAAVISVWADGRDGREGGGSKGAYNRPSYPCHYCTYRGGLLWQGAVDKAKADDQRHAGERQHHHLQARKAVGGKQRKIIHHTLPKRRSQEVRD